MRPTGGHRVGVTTIRVIHAHVYEDCQPWVVTQLVTPSSTASPRTERCEGA
jgi:hypothetical protein